MCVNYTNPSPDLEQGTRLLNFETDSITLGLDPEDRRQVGAHSQDNRRVHTYALLLVLRTDFAVLCLLHLPGMHEESTLGKSRLYSVGQP